MKSVNIRYVGSSGNSYNLKTEDGLKIRTADFHNYSWTADVTALRFGDRLNRFKKAAQTYSATLWFTGNLDLRKSKIESLHRDFETDIVNQSPGRIYWGSDYIECFVISSDTQPDSDGYATKNDITIYCPYPFWIEEVSLHCSAVSQGEVIDTDKGYTDTRYAYSYSYPASQTSKYLHIDHYASSSYKLIAYGPCDSVNVSINGNVYRVNYPLLSNEYMTIDTRNGVSADKVAYVTTAYGTVKNVFNYRDTENSLFTKIGAGDVIVNYSRAYPIDLTIYLERSEPRNNE